MPLSKERKSWKEFAGTPRDQISFAEFIETNRPDTISMVPGEPSVVEMLEVATSLNVKKEGDLCQRPATG